MTDASSDSAQEKRARGLVILAIVVIAASLLGPLAAVGIWDPYELSVADLARRFALNFFPGSQGLALEDLENTMPTRGELARGELPITSIALGFRLFGLFEWAGRLPLALWGLGGAAASYWLVARLADRKAAALTVIVLATTPLYFLQARTMLGDIVTMAAFAGAIAGLGVAVFDRRSASLAAGERPQTPPSARLARLLGLLLAAGALVAGFLSRGILLGVAVPALGVGLSWLLLRASGALARELFGDLSGALALLLGSTAALLGVHVLQNQLAEPEKYFWWLGFGVQQLKKLPTFDSLLLQLGHALFPWSAVLPLAAARLIAPSSALDERRLGLTTLLLVTPALAYLGQSLLAPVAGVLPFTAVTALAAIVPLGLTLDRSAPASRVAGMVVGALALIFLVDFVQLPEKALSGFVLSDLELPESFRATGTKILLAGTLTFAVIFALGFCETEDPARPVFEPEEYNGWIKNVRELWNGNLFFGLLALEAALLGFIAIDWLSNWLPALRDNVTIGGVSLWAARLGWWAVPGLVVLPLLVMAARDVMRSYDRLRARQPRLPGRAVLALASAALLGLTLSLVYFPLFGAHVSPKQAFGAYRKLRKSGDEIALLGASAGGASYYAGGNVPTFAGTKDAFDWLMAGKTRRWLVIKEGDLAALNSHYRAQARPLRNLPVLDATSSEVLLVSSRLESGEQSHNPLAPALPEDKPRPKHRLDVSLADQLQVLGWEVTDANGQNVDAVTPGKGYRFVIYYSVTAPVSGNWETFIHIDGFQRRFNGDHPTLAGKYPFHLFQVGDIIADRYDFTLEPNFAPGDYRVYFGLFTGSRRMEVTRGRHDDNRIEAGVLKVE